MKKFKKIASWILALTMVAGAVPAGFATENVQVSTEITDGTGALLFLEDFEDDALYPVGTLLEVAADATDAESLTVGTMNLKLRPGDKVEIVKEDNGNKYLKLTAGNTTESSSSVEYNFPENYTGGKKRVSYDFYPETHSRYFDNFGVVSDATKTTNEKRLQMMNNYGTDVYLSNGVGGGKPYLSKLLDVTNYNNDFGSVSQEFVLDGKTTDIAVKGANDGMFTNKTGSGKEGNAISRIHWSVRKHSTNNYNGRVTAEDGSDVAGVYRIDNIMVEDIVTLSENNLKMNEDFESYPEGKYHTMLSNANFTVSSGDSIEIAKDPETNSKAIKITKSENTEVTNVVFDYGEVTDKIVKVSYDVRFENHSRLLQGFPKLSTGMQWINYRTNMFWISSFTAETSFANWANIAGDTAVQHVEITHNPKLTEENVKAVVTKENGKVYTDTYTTGVGMAFQTVTFNTAYTTDDDYISHMGTAEGDGVYWIDNISVEILALDLENSSIKAGDTGVPVKKDLVLTFNEPVSEAIKESLFITKGTETLIYGEDYTVTLSDDAKIVTIEAISGEWDYETTYEVVIPSINGAEDILPYQGTIINFVTGKYSSVLVDDDFLGLNLTLGTKWEGPQEVKVGDNVTLKLLEGDSVEWAYDEVTGKNGFKLRKGTTTGGMNFIYSFPESYTNGKYRVSVSERVQNHSQGHNRWPAMLSNATSGEIGRAMFGAGYWINSTGALGMDRFGTNWTSKTSSWINNYVSGSNNIVVGELITGTGYRYGTYTSKAGYAWSKEPATTATTLGGVMMRVYAGGNNYFDGYVKGTAVDTDTVNNPNNDDISWIYSIKVEEILLQVTKTSFEDSQLEFNTADALTVTFNEVLDISTVTADTFKLYKGTELIDSYEYNVSLSEDGKTVTLSPVAGLEFGTNYTINITKDVKPADSEIGGLRVEKNYTLKTVEYVDTVNPDIIWSTIPDGSVNVDYNTGSIIFATNEVLLDASTVTKDNIKVYENGTAIDTYSVNVEENFAVKVSFDGLKKASDYKITITGLKSGGENGLGMTADYELSFTTRDDIYTENVISKISADGTKSVITAELFNKSASDTTYQVIGVLKDSEGKILSVNYGTNGTLVAGGYTDISVEAIKNESAANFDLYIWDGTGTLKPLVKKAEMESVNARTYGYDNFADSEKPVRIAFIGGSITQQGQYTTPLKKSLTTYLRTENPEREVKFVNTAVDGGVGGTGSDLGIYRLEKDVIAKNPDIVFIEFAVNDASGTNRVRTMEGMIRKLMKLDHQPVVILLNVTTSEYTSFDSIKDWEPLMTAYGIGSVNVAEYLKANVATAENPNGLFVWKTAEKETYPNATALTGSDGVHPNAEGGKIYADYMYKVLTENPEKFFKKMNYVEAPVSEYEYNNPRMISWREAEYDDNWENLSEMTWAFADGVASAKRDGATLTFTFTGTTIGLYAPKSVNGGAASYSIDNGAKKGTVSISSGTTSKMEMASVITKELEEGEHTITITVDSLNDKYFKFGYFIVD